MGVYRPTKIARRFGWFFAGTFPLAVVSNAPAAFIGALNGVSTSSTFENATTTTSPAPVGWTAVGSEGIRAFKGSGGTNAAMIAATDSLNPYTAQFDTGVPIQSETLYTLSAAIGFSVTASPGSPENGFSISIGELSGGVFTPLATESSSVEYLYNQNIQAPYYSLSAQTQFTSPVSVDGSDIAVQLSRTTPDATGWLGFDNVTLAAVKVPEPPMPAAVLALPIVLATCVRRDRRPGRL